MLTLCAAVVFGEHVARPGGAAAIAPAAIPAGEASFDIGCNCRVPQLLTPLHAKSHPMHRLKSHDIFPKPLRMVIHERTTTIRGVVAKSLFSNARSQSNALKLLST
eukprot:5665775-Amphidinium_carterae.1